MRQLEEVAIFDQKPESLQWAFDHFFHMAIEMRNRPAAMYLWQNSRMEQHESMLSAASCCGTKNGFHSFQVST